MIIPSYVVVGLAATLPCVIVDFLLYQFLQWLYRDTDLAPRSILATFGGKLISTILNFALAAAFAFTFQNLRSDSLNVLQFGAIVWLIVVVPLVFELRYLQRVQQKVHTLKMISWLLKTGIAAGFTTLFLTGE